MLALPALAVALSTLTGEGRACFLRHLGLAVGSAAAVAWRRNRREAIATGVIVGLLAVPLGHSLTAPALKPLNWPEWGVNLAAAVLTLTVGWLLASAWVCRPDQPRED